MDGEAISDLEQLAYALDGYVALLAVVSGSFVETKPVGINLAAEYRSDFPQQTDVVLRQLTGPLADVLSADERQTVVDLRTAIEAISRETRSLDEQQWQRPGELSRALLPKMRAVRATIYAELGWLTEDDPA